MKLNRLLPPIYRIALGLLACGAVVSGPATAQVGLKRAVQPSFVNGELIVVFQPGIQQQDAQAIATKYGVASIENLGFPQIYRFILPAAKLTAADTVNTVAAMKGEPSIQYVNPNAISTPKAGPVPSVKPNDPRYVSGEQWAPNLIRLPEAWYLQKGSTLVNLADIDSGFAPDHEDMKGRYLPDSLNLSVTPPSPNIAEPTAPSHGSTTSSIMVANTDNGIGMAGACWQNVNCLAMIAGTDATTIQGYSIIMTDRKGPNKLKIGALNMSYGFLRDASNTSDPQYVALKQLNDAGVLLVGAGAEGANPNAGQAGNVPNAYPFVLNVVAGDQTGHVSNFNRFGADIFGMVPRVDLVAPGGDGSGGAGDVLGVSDDKNAYLKWAGTSFACPYVCGVSGLLFSQPGVTRDVARNALLAGANRSAVPGAVPDAQYGFGYLDAYQSLSMVSTQVLIQEPDGVNAFGVSSDPSNVIPQPVETFKPTLSFHFNNVPCDNVTFTIDASIPSIAKSFTLAQLIAGSNPPSVTDFLISGACANVANPNYDVSFRVVFPSIGFFQHTIVVTGVNPASGQTRTDTRLFTITPHTIPGGLTMVSIPYFESNADSPAPFTGQFRDVGQLLGSNVTVYRYLLPSEVPLQGAGTVVPGPYARYTSTDAKANVNASFHPSDSTPTLVNGASAPSGASLDTRPIGLGFFMVAPAAIPVITYGKPFPHSAFRIPLHEGWNLIGDPFPYSVPFNSTEVELPNGTREPIAQAVDQNLILPHIYRLVGGDYQFNTLPDGALVAWEGHWVFVVPRNPANLNAGTVLSIIVDPTPIGTGGRAAAVRPATAPVTRAVGAGGWSLQLIAHAGDKSDGNNYVGMSGNAKDGIDRTKVPKPPKPDSTVALAIVRPDSPATAYAQDLRSLGGNKQWNIQVSTTQPNTNVTIEWPNAHSLPKTYSVILTDEVSGRTFDVRNTSSYQFNSGPNAGTRSFTLVARPTTGVAGRPIFSNIVVNPGRANGRAQNVFNIAYNLSTPANVSVSIMTPGGHPVAQIVTRAVSAGDNSLSWNGLDSAGRPVAAGAYILQFQAATTEGQTTRVIRPLVLTGRSE